MPKTLLALLLAFSSGYAHFQAIGGGGMIPCAFHIGMAGKSGWVNPYVTDGLVAMWDGEWNAGGGVHDANATVWTDLMRPDFKHKFNISGEIFLDNGLLINGIKNIGGTYEDFYLYDFFGKEYPSGMTYECAIDIENLSSQEESLFRYRAAGSGPLFVCAPWGYTRITGGGNGGYGREVSDAYNLLPYIGLRFNKTFSLIYPSMGFYVNGNDSLKHLDGGINIDERYNMQIGTGGQDAIIHSIRIYSRELTPAEIAHNYAIDKARFNLP